MIGSANAASIAITEDFEGGSPDGWTAIGAGVTTAATGNPGNGLTVAAGENYLSSDFSFDTTEDFNGSFDFILDDGAFYDNISFFVGDFSTLNSGANDYFRVDLKKATFGRRASIYNGNGNTDPDKLFNGDNNNQNSISDGNWYTTDFAWTAATKSFTFGWELAGGGGAKGPMTFTGFSFNDPEAVKFGLGTIDAAGRFDNFSVTGVETVPEPSSTALLGLGGLALMFRRHR